MKILAFIVLGLLIGWLIEWIIDWLYWRKQYKRVENENAVLKEQIKVLKAEKEKQPKPRAKKATRKKSKPQKDDLKRIVGIGPVISKKLNEAGINTYEQLGKLTPKRLEDILGDLIKRLSDEDDLIKQAKKYAKEKKSKA